MTTTQQQESLEFFRRHAPVWRDKAENRINAKVNVIEQRNGFVLQIAKERTRVDSFLDVGCGTGELVCDAAANGIRATGVDYAPEMIKLASKKAQDEGNKKAAFTCSSIFEFALEPGTYDLISANGFIEYISLKELHDLFDLVARALAPGGSFVVGSRNRLFNLVSMNAYTLEEIKAGASEQLQREAVQWGTGTGIEKALELQAAPLQAAETKHATTGIDVVTRFQYSPVQLINLLKGHALEAVEVYPIHIHGVPPSYKQADPELHVHVANTLQASARHNTRLLTQSSSFMVHARKAE
jgi:2-polyprenyl-3-methyl-5-hydroxy-6-metoxy-1,4-benzoquinol methylase